MSTVATGTVTYVDGRSVLAFGHPLFGIGEVYLPLVDARDSRVPSQPGAVVQDVVAAERGRHAGAGPPVVHHRRPRLAQHDAARSTCASSGPGVEPRLFHAEVARNRRLTPMLASMVVGNAIADAEPDVTDMVVTVTSKVGVKGYQPLELRDQIFSPEGVSGRALALSRGLRAMGELLFNPFEPVVLDRIDVDVRVEYRRDVAEIIGVSLPGQEVHAGDTVPLRVTLRPYAGTEYVETVPVVIPRTVARRAAQDRGRLGALVRPDVPQAESLRGYIDNLRKYYTASTIVVDAADRRRRARRCAGGLSRACRRRRWIRCARPTRPSRADAYPSPIAPCYPRGSSSAASRSCTSWSSRTCSGNVSDRRTFAAQRRGALSPEAVPYNIGPDGLVTIAAPHAPLIAACVLVAAGAGRDRRRDQDLSPDHAPRTSRRARPPASMVLPTGDVVPGMKSSAITLDAAFVWCGALSPDGKTAYFGTGDQGQHLRGRHGGDGRRGAPRRDAGGGLGDGAGRAPRRNAAAGTTPGGRVYTVDPEDGQSEGVRDAPGRARLGAGPRREDRRPSTPARAAPGKIFADRRRAARRARLGFGRQARRLADRRPTTSTSTPARRGGDPLPVSLDGHAEALADFDAEEVRALARVRAARSTSRSTTSSAAAPRRWAGRPPRRAARRSPSPPPDRRRRRARCRGPGSARRRPRSTASSRRAHRADVLARRRLLHVAGRRRQRARLRRHRHARAASTASPPTAPPRWRSTCPSGRR